MPFIEQGNVLSKVNYDFNEALGIFSPAGQFDFDRDANGLRDGVDLAPSAVMTCTSAGTPRWARDYFAVQGGQEGLTSNPRFSSPLGPIHNDGVLGMNHGRSIGLISDGTSNTLTIGENHMEVYFGYKLSSTAGIRRSFAARSYPQ